MGHIATVSASETGRTSEWAASLTPSERANVYALGWSYLTRLYEVAVKGWEDVAADALSDMCSVKVPLEERDLIQPHARLLRSLIVSLSQPNHALRIHAIKMLKHVLSPSPNIFDGAIDASIKNIAGMAVSDDPDGLELLTELATGERMRGQITEALVSSIRSGLTHYEDQPRIRTITFIQSLSIGEDVLLVSGGPLYSAVNEVIPNLVEVALDESSPDDVRLPAMRLVQKLWNNGLEVRDSLLNYLSLVLDGSEFNRRYNFLVALKDLQNREEYKPGAERPPYTFPWLFPAEFVEAVVTSESMFEKIVEVSIHDEHRSIQVAGQELIKQLANDDRFVWYLKVDALKWIETATVLPSYHWRVRHNGVLVLETFIKRLETEHMDLLKKLVELALKDDNNDVRTAALSLISSICEDRGLSDEALEYVKDTILSYDALPVDESWEDSEPPPPPVPGDAIIREPYSSICNSWIPLICTISKQEPEDMHVFINAMAGDLELDPRKTEEWDRTAKWVRLLAALLGHGILEEPVRKALDGVVKDLENAINGNIIEQPEPKEEPAVKDTDYSSTRSASDHESEETHPENTYMAESSLSLPMRKYLVGLNWLERRYWVDVLANTAGHFPKQLAEAPAIIIQMAIHDPDSDVRNSVRNYCLQSMIVLAKREVAPHVATLLEDRDWNVRFSLAQFLGALGKSPGITLPEDIVTKLIKQAMVDSDYDCRSEFVNSMAILASVEGEGGQGPGKFVEAMSQAIYTHFETGIKDDSWKVRQSWVNFVGPHVKHADFFGINKIVDAAIKDTDSNVRGDALRWLQEFLKDGKHSGVIVPSVLNLIDILPFSEAARLYGIEIWDITCVRPQGSQPM
ncbi:hypothetical protein D9611_013350 [Ephemerocybe angulata]|uniref:ARM repeat-containing protein n=1 Tax=Ephemerocybe angulata TaxID=980116 RepID=A0A8H5CBN3_9AGAR|nr:hypothetical protein D9611_013350 [Tulosesus angulatus]